MKRSTIYVLIIAAFLLLPLAGRLLWVLKRNQTLDLVIVNKTVNSDSGNEMKALNWVLNYKKILKTGNAPYDFTKDYYGYHPDAINPERTIRTFSLEEARDLARTCDGAIYLDNEGGIPGENKEDRFGGFNQVDFFLLNDMINSGKLVVSEFNFFSDPTEDFVRYNAEIMMDIYSLRWIGKYFENLKEEKITDQIDNKWIECYMKNTSSSWEFEGPGLILCNEKQNRVVVLPSSKYTNGLTPVIRTAPEMAEEYSLPEEAAFTGWFDVVYEGENEVISFIDLNVNQEGMEVLKNNGLESIFPATIKLRDKPAYYFAGDFSKQKVFLGWSRIELMNSLCRFVCQGMTRNPNQFFQTYYVPFMSGILENYYHSSRDGSV